MRICEEGICFNFHHFIISRILWISTGDGLKSINVPCA